MKILHLLVTLDRGGAENHVADLAVQQRLAGHDVSVAYLKGSGNLADMLISRGIVVTNLRMKFYGDPSALVKLILILCSQKPDLAHAHLPGAEIYLAASRLLIFKKHSITFLATRHNDAPFGNNALFIWLERLVSRQFSHTICISKAVQDLFVGRRKTLVLERTSVIYYGIDPTKFNPISQNRSMDLRLSWQIQKDEFILLCISRMVPQKGLDILLRAYALARCSKAMRPSTLIMVGTGPLTADLMALAEELNILSSIRWLGLRDDIPAILATCNCLILCSHYEGLGLVLLEAAAAGKPVIATRASAIPEIVVDKHTGILIEPGNIEKFSEAIVLLQDVELQQRLGEQAQKHVITNFSNKECFSNTMLRYRSLENS